MSTRAPQRQRKLKATLKRPFRIFRFFRRSHVQVGATAPLALFLSLIFTPPEVTNTGPGFNRGPGAAFGGVASKNGWGHMRARPGITQQGRSGFRQ